MKIFIFYNLKNLCILHGQVFVMTFVMHFRHNTETDVANVLKGPSPKVVKLFFQLSMKFQLLINTDISNINVYF